MKVSAVITSDIVKSTVLSAQQQLSLNRAIKKIFINEKIEFYSGDSFQVYCKNPIVCYDLVLQTRTVARSISQQADIRTGIGIGKVKLPIHALSTSHSEAFILSGRSFDELKESNKKLIITCSNHQNDIAFEIISIFTDYLIDRMTPAQAEAIFHILSGKTQKQVAGKLKKAQPTIAKHARAGGWSELELLSTRFKNLVNDL